MYDWVVLWDWIELAVRWLHVITGIAWIGSSFYFIALDLGLHRDRNLASGADGEEWQVHGGALVSPGDTPSPGEHRPSASETEWESNVVRADLLTC